MNRIKGYNTYNEGIFDHFKNKRMISKRSHEIDTICKKYRIEDYKINDDGLVDIVGDVGFTGTRFFSTSILPLKFGRVSGTFDCGNTKIRSLEGCPTYIGGDFYCNSNLLESMEGCGDVGGDISCNDNELTSFKGLPKSVNGIYCQDNDIWSFEGFPEKCDQLVCANNPIFYVFKLFWDVKRIPMFQDYDIIREDRVIILDRLKEFLQDAGNEKYVKIGDSTFNQDNWDYIISQLSKLNYKCI